MFGCWLENNRGLKTEEEEEEEEGTEEDEDDEENINGDWNEEEEEAICELYNICSNKLAVGCCSCSCCGCPPEKSPELWSS